MFRLEVTHLVINLRVSDVARAFAIVYLPLRATTREGMLNIA